VNLTTIAFKKGLLAADSQVTVDNDVKMESADKIEILNDYTIFAGAGTEPNCKIAARFFALPNWEELLGTDKTPTFRTKDLDGILIYKGQAYSVDTSLFPDRIVHPFYAIGSGWKFALAAMHLGLSAPEAVKFASELDVYTGGVIRVLNVKAFFENSSTRAAPFKRKRRAKKPQEVQAKEEGNL
jgi:hypothetical protein